VISDGLIDFHVKNKAWSKKHTCTSGVGSLYYSEVAPLIKNRFESDFSESSETKHISALLVAVRLEQKGILDLTISIDISIRNTRVLLEGI
ncbi:hypothetical protein ACJX0J_026764, partial [Zea mays]